MKFVTDCPVSHLADDALGRAAFARYVSRALVGLNVDQSIAIGIVGPWGSGKTSLINMICEELSQNESIEDTLKNNSIVMRFNPWNVVEPANLIVNFFEELREKLEEYDSSLGCGKMLGEITEAINGYIKALKPTPENAIVSFLLDKVISRNKKQAKSISYQKRAVSNVLTKVNKTIVVVIDDIDRLGAQQITSIFQLVATVADFPSVSYLLAYDQSVVCKALKTVQDSGAQSDEDGMHYLEKIVQVPLYVPEISRATISSMLSERIGIAMHYVTEDQEKTDAGQRLSELAHIISPRVQTLRELKRFENALLFELASSDNKVDPVDLTAMSFCKTFFPKAFEWIGDHRGEICLTGRLDAPVSSFSDESRKKLNESFSKEAELGEQDRVAFSLVQHVFMDPRCVEGVSRSHLKFTKRLIDIDLFNSYYAGVLESYESVHAKLIMSLAMDNSEPLIAYVDSAFRSGRSAEAVETVRALENNIPDHAVPGLMRCVCSQLSNADYSDMYYSELTRAIDCIDSLALRLGEEQASQTMVQIFSRFDDIAIAYLAEFIIRQDRAYLRNGFSGGRYEKLINETTLAQIEARYSESMYRLFVSGKLYGRENLRAPLLLFEHIDEQKFREALNEEKDNPLCIILCGELFIDEWRSFDSIFNSSQQRESVSWAAQERTLQFLSREDLIHMAKRAATSDEFWAASELLRLKAAALVECARLNKFGEVDGIDSEDAAIILQRWKASPSEWFEENQLV